MNIFLCHSEPQSRKVAKALKPFLSKILQRAKMFYSEEDIPKGATWAQEIADNLETTSNGILCLTPENFQSPWIHFEAGAIFKGSGKSRIHGYLYKLKPTEIKDPLGMFQVTVAEKDDTLKLVTQLNKGFGGDGLGTKDLNELFELCWPSLETALKNIPTGSVSKTSVERTPQELLEEILERVRGLGEINMQIPGVIRKLLLHQIKSPRERQEELEEEEEKYREAFADSQAEEWEARQQELAEEAAIEQEERYQRQQEDSP